MLGGGPVVDGVCAFGGSFVTFVTVFTLGWAGEDEDGGSCCELVVGGAVWVLEEPCG